MAKRSFFLFFAVLFLLAAARVPAAAMDGCICDANPDSSCYSDGCTRKTIQNDGSINSDICANNGCGGVYNACYINGNLTVARYFCVTQPPCCADMVKNNNAGACCWPERAFCHPTTCSRLTTQERCGWYWTFHQDWTNRPEGYGCMKGDSEGTMIPIFGLPAGVPGAQPTATPAPTARPTAQPTDIPPTSAPAPTAAPVIPSDIPPTAAPMTIPTSSPVNPEPGAPVRNTDSPLPLQARIMLRSAVITADRGFRAAGETVTAMKNADRRLEETINKLLAQIFSRIRSLL